MLDFVLQQRFGIQLREAFGWAAEGLPDFLHQLLPES